MNRLAIDYFAVRGDYRGNEARCKERNVKGKESADFRWVFVVTEITDVEGDVSRADQRNIIAVLGR
jgi:hypothetical protein